MQFGIPAFRIIRRNARGETFAGLSGWSAFMSVRNFAHSRSVHFPVWGSSGQMGKPACCCELFDIIAQTFYGHAC